MSKISATSVPAIKFEVVVQEDGHISVTVPFSPGKRVIVFVVQEQESDEPWIDLVQAATSSTDFWDNPYDDEDWNNA